jgi:hypothetical protein
MGYLPAYLMFGKCLEFRKLCIDTIIQFLLNLWRGTNLWMDGQFKYYLILTDFLKLYNKMSSAGLVDLWIHSIIFFYSHKT